MILKGVWWTEIFAVCDKYATNTEIKDGCGENSTSHSMSRSPSPFKRPPGGLDSYSSPAFGYSWRESTGRLFELQQGRLNTGNNKAKLGQHNMKVQQTTIGGKFISSAICEAQVCHVFSKKTTWKQSKTVGKPCWPAENAKASMGTPAVPYEFNLRRVHAQNIGLVKSTFPIERKCHKKNSSLHQKKKTHIFSVMCFFNKVNSSLQYCTW